jgi:hypothetical protein
MEASKAMGSNSKHANTISSTQPQATQHQTSQTADGKNPKTSPEVERNQKRTLSLTENENVVQSYYADKGLAWWLQLARDFKSAKQLPLPSEEGEDL